VAFQNFARVIAFAQILSRQKMSNGGRTLNLPRIVLLN